ncbi:MAG: sigma-54-dependent Fis family transcriptional regulator [Rhodobiaceae bacterium]|nr:sigma-54-dependent Fis family transcriptional regulator [Rhodobiaceae bacterium]MCC0018857.1 sigma-54-dependent Fis family transcriptional regulator [Rhodobiaceae bacterium]MCC0051712.1 sigma-54-dependent Fis family transcriptional regulator [Rhodobiaceae bacterium]MCC0060748.1 sigma-54-dependent Fis family transcriptional regulator [Rhodobiaceae bacterium]
MERRQTADHSDRIASALSGDGPARSPLVASWSRSARLHGLDPESGHSPDRLTDTELRAVQDAMELTIRASRPSLDNLFRAVGSAGCCVMLASPDGIPVERRGITGDDADFEGCGLWTGTLWSEAREGTNGIGTCLTEKRQVTIHRNQHFLRRNTGLSCMSAPLFDPHGLVAGALDVSCAREDMNEAFAGLVAHSVSESVRRIEEELLRLWYPHARLVMLPCEDKGYGGLLAVDKDDLVIGVTQPARNALGLVAGDLSSNPRPLSDLLGLAADDGFEAAERAVLSRALARAGGNVTAAARELGISRATFHRKLGRIGN